MSRFPIRKAFKWGALILLGIYIAFPAVAGGLGLGERCGPRIYFRTHHALLYSPLYNATHEDTCRCGCLWRERPLFYGLDQEKLEREAGR